MNAARRTEAATPHKACPPHSPLVSSGEGLTGERLGGYVQSTVLSRRIWQPSDKQGIQRSNNTAGRYRNVQMQHTKPV